MIEYLQKELDKIDCIDQSTEEFEKKISRKI